MQTILVTGSPRSGTTPVGDLLSRLPRTVSLYEPMGPTGDRRFENRFPVVHPHDMSTEALTEFLGDMTAKRLRLKSQVRPGQGQTARMRAKIIGSRTRMTYLRYRFTPGLKRLIWKDPHAVFAANAAEALGVKVVLTARHPCASAASHKRLGWCSQAKNVFTRVPAAFDGIEGLAEQVDRHGADPVGSAAVLWRMIYEYQAQFGFARRRGFFLLNPNELSADEEGTYGALFDWLGHPMPTSVADLIAERQITSPSVPTSGRVHDFSRSAAAANSYWQSVLTDEEAETVMSIAGPTWERLTAKQLKA